jgi:DNA polymerase-3 subunit alpha
MAAVLTSVRDDKDKSALYLNECRRMGIQVLPPDVNESSANFTAVGADIRFGLTAIRNVGANVVDGIVEARAEKGRYESFTDFLTKVPAVVCNKRTIESLIKAGSFDSLGHVRRALVAKHEDAVDAVVDVKRNEAIGQFDLFAGLGGADDAAGASGFEVVIPDLPEWEKAELLAHERQMLGLYVSDHPLFGLERLLSNASDMSISSLLEDESRPDGSQITIAGMITGLQRKTTKQGNYWAIVTVEDLAGAIECLFFPQAYMDVAQLLAEDLVVVVKGRLNRRDEVPTIYASGLTVPDISSTDGVPVTVTLPTAKCTTQVVEQLKTVLETHAGSTEVRLRLTKNGGGNGTLMRLDDSLRVTPSPALFGDLKQLLGPACLV